MMISAATAILLAGLGLILFFWITNPKKEDSEKTSSKK